MIKLRLLTAILMSACCLRSRDDSSITAHASTPSLETSVAHSSTATNTYERNAPELRMEPQTLGYVVAAEALAALAECFSNSTCGASARQTLREIKLLGLNLDTTAIARPIPGCTQSASAVIQSGFCGMMSGYDVDNLRASVSDATACLRNIGNNRPECIEVERRAGTWLGRHSCSRLHPAELQDAARAQSGAFEARQPWVVQVSRVTTVAWTICLEGVDEKLTGMTVSATFAGE